MNKNQKAAAQLDSIDIYTKLENDTVYVCIGDTYLELSEFEINFRAEEYDKNILIEEEE